ncbi:MAG: hypothetical protein ABEH77_10890 [Halobacteriaceae archaeon]
MLPPRTLAGRDGDRRAPDTGWHGVAAGVGLAAAVPVALVAASYPRLAAAAIALGVGAIAAVRAARRLHRGNRDRGESTPSRAPAHTQPTPDSD